MGIWRARTWRSPRERVLDHAAVGHREVVGESVERRARSQPDQFGPDRGGVPGNRLDDPGERGRAVVLDVGRDLGDVARREPQADRSDRLEPFGTALADPRRDRARVLERRRRRQLDVEGDERRSGRNQHGAGGRMEPARPEVRAELVAGDPARQRRRAAEAELGAGPSLRELAVQEHGKLELVAEQVAEDKRLCARGTAISGVEVHDRRDVVRTHAWMNPFVVVDVDAADHLGGAVRDRLRQLHGLTCEREHAAMVVGVGVNVEKAGVKRQRDRVDRGRVAALRHVRDREQRHRFGVARGVTRTD